MWAKERSNHSFKTFCTVPMATYGAAVLRIGYGIASVAYYVTNYTDRKYLWAVDGVYPFSAFEESLFRPAFSLYEFATSNTAFEFIFHIGIAVAVLFTLGVGGRLMTCLHYIFMFSIFIRNPILLDGGDNLAFLVLLYLIPVNTTTVLAVRRKKMVSNEPRLAVLLHNTGLTFIVTQLCILYLASAMYKIQGQFWQDGTALYYILKVPEYSWPVITDHIITNSWLVAAVTYCTVFFQVLFPALILRKETRVLVVILGIIFHGGIALFMGLTAFSIYLIATEAVLLSNQHYENMMSKMRMARNFFSNRLRMEPS